MTRKQATPSAKRPTRILVIEDDEELRLLTSDILGLSGYAVESAEDGLQGVAKALASPPDLILCDVLMPGLDGRGVLKALKNADPTRAVPLIFISARADLDTIEQAMAEGASAYLVKPFTHRELLASVDQFLPGAPGR